MAGAIAALAGLERGSATLADAELALDGVARDDDARAAVELLLSERMPKDFRAKTALSTELDETLKGEPLAEAAPCQALVDAVVRTGGPEFVFDGPALFGHQRRLFERLALTLEIGAHSSGIGDPDAARALSERWAEAVAEALARAGAERGRLRTVGFGNSRPLADGETEAGRLRNRRIVFRIAP